MAKSIEVLLGGEQFKRLHHGRDNDVRERIFGEQRPFGHHTPDGPMLPYFDGGVAFAVRRGTGRYVVCWGGGWWWLVVVGGGCTTLTTLITASKYDTRHVRII